MESVREIKEVVGGVGDDFYFHIQSHHIENQNHNHNQQSFFIFYSNQIAIFFQSQSPRRNLKDRQRWKQLTGESKNVSLSFHW